MSDDSAFFEELQMDFLNESAFMLEQYEEYMMNLENSENPVKDLTDIFRVAHSVKGGAAAVGLIDLSKFAHVMEDLLDLLRSHTEYVNSEVISVLLKSGDELKSRIQHLQQGLNDPWSVQDLQNQLESLTHRLSGEQVPGAQALALVPTETGSLAETPAPAEAEEDHTNHELLAELLSQLSPEDQAEFHAQEEAAKPATPVPLATAEPALQVVKTEAKSAGAKAKPTSVIKVDTGRVDSVLDAVGELVVIKNLLVHDDTVAGGNSPRLLEVIDQLDKAVRELYEKTLSIRMTPLKSMFIKIQRLVRDVSLNLDKPVDLQLIGEDTEVERTVFELLGDPLVHLVRNSMDHGVENREKRQAAGKPEVAKVTVSAKQSGGNVIIDIADDGGGINRQKVLQKAIDRGLVSSDTDPSAIPDETVFQYLFHAGFSTADKVSDLSGRGVGLDVVKSNLDKIQGKINIFSTPGLGTTFRLTIPLSTAITDGIIVTIKNERYILPIHSIYEIVRLSSEEFTDVTGAGRVANVRGSLLPVIDVDKALGSLSLDHLKISSDTSSAKNKKSEELLLVILESSQGQVALPVDAVLGQAQVVVKPVAVGYEIPEVAGAAILGDGKTVLILDPHALARVSFHEVAA